VSATSRDVPVKAPRGHSTRALSRTVRPKSPQRGQIALDFSREAKSAEQAVISAISDVKKAIPDAKFIEAAPDFVDVPDIADALGVTRQYVRKIVLQNVRDFPPAVFNDMRAIWHLDIVLHYMVDRKIRRVDDALLEIARANRMFNHAVEKRELLEVPAVYLQAVG
jgi:hypothetical protein